MVPDFSSPKVLVPAIVSGLLLHLLNHASLELLIPLYAAALMLTFLVMGNYFTRTEIIINALMMAPIAIHRPSGTNEILIFALAHMILIATIRVIFPVALS